MEEAVRIETARLTSVKQVRSPLSSRSANWSSSTQDKSVRRKSTFVRNSSDTIPSSHTSIFEAEYLSSGDDIALRLESWTVSDVPETQDSVNEDENTCGLPFLPEIGTTPILYGRGTQLTTIVEQKSSTTMRSVCSNPSISLNLSAPSSTSNFSNLSKASTEVPTRGFLTSVGRSESPDILLNLSQERRPRRKKSFSADDISIIKKRKLYHETCSMIEDTTQRPLPVHKIYAEPKAPVQPPMKRPGTPPGVPSWTEGQRPRLALDPSQNDVSYLANNGRQLRRSLFQRFLYSESTHSRNNIPRAQSQGSSLLRGSSSPGSTRQPPRFHPIRSGHGIGSLDSHPFSRAPDNPRKEESAIGPAMPPFYSVSNNGMSANMRTTSHLGRIGVPHTRSRSVGRPSSNATTIRIGQVVGASNQTPTIGNMSSHKGKKSCPHGKCMNAPDSSDTATRGSNIPAMGRQWNSLFHDIQTDSDPTQQAIIPSIVIHPSSPTIDLQSQLSPESLVTIPPISNDDVPHISSAALIPNSLAVQEELKAHLCWKCRFKSITAAMDQVWEGSAHWCCWVCCGVRLDDDGGQESHELLRPRRVVVDGAGVMVYG